ncbi:MAG: pyrimidine dimer DNA glycosylase/endonuclease V [Bacteroidia bacterium]
MTRINVGIPPKELTSKHLIAEHREIKRIPNCVSKGRFNLKNTPLEFKLGKGHVSFFYNKLLFLKNRYEDIYKECIDRGFKVSYWGECWKDIPQCLMNDYSPTLKDENLIRERIKERLDKKI